MFLIRTWILGLKSLLLHPLRSLLTVLGIFIGVASVIWLVAIGEGISQEAQRQIEGLGADNIIVRTVKPPSEVIGRLHRPRALRPDTRRLREAEEHHPDDHQAHCPSARSAARSITGAAMVDGRLVGCTPEYSEVTRLEIDRGRFLTAVDIEQRHNFCVLAAKLAERLFPYEDPMGRRVFLPESLDYFEVVGV